MNGGVGGGMGRWVAICFVFILFLVQTRYRFQTETGLVFVVRTQGARRVPPSAPSLSLSEVVLKYEADTDSHTLWS